MAHESPAANQLRLPVLVFGIVEVRRLKRELETLQDYLRQAQIREPGKQAPLPRVSRLLDALATDNGLQLLQPTHRTQLERFLVTVEKQAPNIHMSFATDPSSAFTAKMVTWLRMNIHPYILLEVGLQPTIAAGCIVRTTNKIFDFSLREHFSNARGLLMRSLETVETASAVPAASVAGATPLESAPVTVVTPVQSSAAATSTPASAAPGAAT